MNAWFPSSSWVKCLPGVCSLIRCIDTRTPEHPNERKVICEIFYQYCTTKLVARGPTIERRRKRSEDGFVEKREKKERKRKEKGKKERKKEKRREVGRQSQISWH